MTTVVAALYEDLAAAQRATQDLVDHGGFNRQNISIAASDASGEYRRYIGDEEQLGGEVTGDSVIVGAGIGAALGGIGGLLVGVGSLLIPGVGPKRLVHFWRL